MLGDRVLLVRQGRAETRRRQVVQGAAKQGLADR
jgi:hypothetical protein